MPTPPLGRAGALRRWLPAAALVAVAVAAFGSGLHHHISLEALALNRDALRTFVDQHLALAVLLYMGLYIALVALSIPGAAVMSIAGGFLFGWALSVPATLTAAVVGSVIVFHIVKTTAGAALAEHAGPAVKKLSAGFAENAFYYLLFLRLAPVFPFVIVNAVAGLSRVPIKTFVVATAIGIVPASFAFALLGASLDGIIATELAKYESCAGLKGAENCHLTLSLSALVTPQLLAAFAVLGVIALVPVALRHLKGAKTT